jgi:hypothetical protein
MEYETYLKNLDTLEPALLADFTGLEITTFSNDNIKIRCTEKVLIRLKENFKALGGKQDKNEWYFYGKKDCKDVLSFIKEYLKYVISDDTERNLLT